MNHTQILNCPFCQKPIPPGQFALAQDIEPAALGYIHSHYPDWQPEQGICPTCLQNILNTLAEQNHAKTNDEQGVSLETRLYGILPVGLRLGANNNFNGGGVTIAFLDSGFSAHPDLDRRIKLYVDVSQHEIKEISQVEESGDLSWHGTMTSVVACGNGSLSGGLYRGLASGAQVVLIKVSNAEGRVNEESIGRGLGWILTNGRKFGIQIVNISLGGDRPTDYSQNPVDLMVEALSGLGTLVVCAAGNAGERTLLPPASAPSAITVGGLDDKNSLDPEASELWHSNYGQTHKGVWKPELVAPSLWLAAPVLPGSNVSREAALLEALLSEKSEEISAKLAAASDKLNLTVIPSDLYTKSPNEIKHFLWDTWRSQKLINQHYQHVDGTSFAAPIVSSVAAQMLQANKGLSPAGLKDLLMRTARYLPEIAPDQQGHGVVDPWAAVAAAQTTSISSN